MDSILEFNAVDFGHGGKHLFQGLSFSVQEGAFVLVTGPSGGGKSTLLRLVCRLEEPWSGTVRYQGKPLYEYDPPALRRELHYMQQTPVLTEGSVRKNLLLPFSFAANKDFPPPSDEELGVMLGEYLLDTVQLGDEAQGLSVGQQQRVCLIRALLLKPKVLLLDEPVSALDPQSRELVEAKAERLNLEHGVTVLMVSHQEFTPRQVRPELLEVRNGAAAYRR